MNSFSNPPTLPPPAGYSHLVSVPGGGRTIYLSGQVPLDPSGLLVGPGDFAAQAEQAFANISTGLASAGADFSHVVKLGLYLRDMANLPILRTVRDRHINLSAPPASTLVEVSRFFRDDILVEIKAIAVIPG